MSVALCSRDLTFQDSPFFLGVSLAQVDEQLSRHQVLPTPAPTQAPGDNGNPLALDSL